MRIWGPRFAHPGMTGEMAEDMTPRFRAPIAPEEGAGEGCDC